MKKVLVLSLALILILGIMSHGTSSYFSDRETSAGNTFTAWVEEVVCAKFNVSDITTNDRRIFIYDVDVSNNSASFIDFFDLHPDNGKPSGVASVGDYIYVLEWANKVVYKYDCCGNFLGVSKDLKRSGSSIANPDGLAISGNDMWVVAYGQNLILYRYSLSVAFSGPGEIDANLQIVYHEENTFPSGLAINSTEHCLYVLDSTTKRFYRYDYLNYDPDNPPVPRADVSKVLRDMGGTPLYSPAGAMFDGTYLWVVDDRQANDLNRAYKYDVASLFDESGTTEDALWEFDLDEDNIGSTGL